MTEWTAVSVSALDRYVAAQHERFRTLPAYDLLPPEQTPRTRNAVEFDRHPVSGILQATAPASLYREPFPAYGPIMDIFRGEDQRWVRQPEPAESQSLLWTAETYISVDSQRDVNVIGPGGRIMAFRNDDVIDVDVVVRRRGAQRDTSWLRPATISELARLRLTTIDASLSVAFGYYEASKYVPQTLLRPVFIVALVAVADERSPGFIEHAVVPATVVEGRDELAGLEDWF